MRKTIKIKTVQSSQWYSLKAMSVTHMILGVKSENAAEDCDDPNNYCGISLLGSLSKIFTSILNAKFTEWTEENAVFEEAQAGFKQSYLTTDHRPLYTLLLRNNFHAMQNFMRPL